MNAQIIPDELIALQRVIDFAKENGFPGAHALFWDDYMPEHGMTSINDIVQERGEEYRIRIGVDLGGKPLIAVREWTDDISDDQIVFKQNTNDPRRESGASDSRIYRETMSTQENLEDFTRCTNCGGDPMCASINQCVAEINQQVYENEAEWLRSKAAEIYHDWTLWPVCPHCGHEDFDWYVDTTIKGAGDSEHTDCINCNKSYTQKMNQGVTFKTFTTTK